MVGRTTPVANLCLKVLFSWHWSTVSRKEVTCPNADSAGHSLGAYACLSAAVPTPCNQVQTDTKVDVPTMKKNRL